MLVARKVAVTRGFIVPNLGSTGAPSLWCNYGNLWLIILEPCGTYSLKKREEFLGVREDAGIELHYAICTVYYNFSMSAVLVSNINALPFICMFKDMWEKWWRFFISTLLLQLMQVFPKVK